MIAGGNPTGKFTADHLALAAAIAHQAALAVEETRYHQALVQAERLAAVGQTIAALSHHIKNILQGLQIGGKVLKIGIDDGDQDALRRGWAIVEKNQGKIYELVMDMLSYSKEREPSLEETDLGAVASDVVELLGPRRRTRRDADSYARPTCRNAPPTPKALIGRCSTSSATPWSAGGDDGRRGCRFRPCTSRTANGCAWR